MRLRICKLTHHRVRPVGFLTLGLLATLVAVVSTARTAAQEGVSQEGRTTARRTVWDGVYLADQAARGRGEYESHCAHCHEVGEAPDIVGERFLRNWYEDSLNVPFTKMRTEMPQDNPGSLAPPMYADILSYLLEEAGFPAGKETLLPDSEKLAAIMIVDQGGSAASVPNFSLVQVVGCLAQDGAVWTLRNGTAPARAREPGNSPPADLQAFSGTALGSESFQLLAVQAQHGALKGHKVQAKGFLNRNPSGDRITVTSLQSVADSCAP